MNIPMNFVRIGNRLMNLDNVIFVHLNHDDKGGVMVEFNRDDFSGKPRKTTAKAKPAESAPYKRFFEGAEAEALTAFFSDARLFPQLMRQAETSPGDATDPDIAAWMNPAPAGKA